MFATFLASPNCTFVGFKLPLCTATSDLFPSSSRICTIVLFWMLDYDDEFRIFNFRPVPTQIICPETGVLFRASSAYRYRSTLYLCIKFCFVFSSSHALSHILFLVLFPSRSTSSLYTSVLICAKYHWMPIIPPNSAILLTSFISLFLIADVVVAPFLAFVIWYGSGIAAISL